MKNEKDASLWFETNWYGKHKIDFQVPYPVASLHEKLKKYTYEVEPPSQYFWED